MNRWIETSATNRQGELKVEIPDEPWAGAFFSVAGTLFPKVREASHPLLRRADIIVQFPERIILTGDQNETFRGKPVRMDGISTCSVEQRGSFITSISPLVISISRESVERLKTSSPDIPGHIMALAIAFHEMEEVNFNLQSIRLDQAKPGDPDYRAKDHERIPDLRATRWLRLETGEEFEIS